MQFNYDPSLSFYHLLYKCCLTPKYAISEEPRLRPRAIGLFDIITTRPARRSLLLPHFLVSTFTSISSIYRGISYSGSVVYGIFANTPLLMHSTTLATTVLILSRVGDVLSVAYRVLEYTGQSLKYVGEAFWQTCIEVGGFVTNFFSISFKPSVKPLYIPEHATGAASTMQYHVRPVTMMDRISNYLPTIPPSYVYGTALGITGILYSCSIMYWSLLFHRHAAYCPRWRIYQIC